MIPEFALRLICGLSSMWCLAPRRQITSGFFRIQMLLTLGLSVLAAVTASQLPINDSISTDRGHSLFFLASLALAFLSFAGSVAWTLERRRGGTIFAGIIFLVATGTIFGTAEWGGNEKSLFVAGLANDLTAAWILGAATGTMLLGHWYLTATGMPLQPLINDTRLFGIAILVRILVVFWLEGSGFHVEHGNWTLLVLQWGGLLGPALMAGLTFRILKYRNTQSATGVLYAATILVFMGEMAASLLGAAQAN